MIEDWIILKKILSNNCKMTFEKKIASYKPLTIPVKNQKVASNNIWIIFFKENISYSVKSKIINYLTDNYNTKKKKERNKNE